MWNIYRLKNWKVLLEPYMGGNNAEESARIAKDWLDSVSACIPCLTKVIIFILLVTSEIEDLAW